MNTMQKQSVGRAILRAHFSFIFNKSMSNTSNHAFLTIRMQSVMIYNQHETLTPRLAGKFLALQLLHSTLK